MQDRAHPRAVGQLVLAALLWSLGGLLIKTVDWPPLAVAGGRGLIAALFLAALSRPLRFTFSRIQLLAALAYAACTISFVAATKLTTAANAILLQYTAPVWVALLGAWFLGERTTRGDWVAIAAVFCGMGLFFAEGLAFSGAAGNLVAVLSGVAFALMTLALRRQKDGSPVESIILGNLIAFLVGLPWMLAAPAPSALGWAALALLGTVQLGMSYWLYSKAIRSATALEAVLIPVIEPVLNPVWVFLARGEKPSRWAVAGAAVVLSAVVLRSLPTLRRAGGAACLLALLGAGKLDAAGLSTQSPFSPPGSSASAAAAEKAAFEFRGRMQIGSEAYFNIHNSTTKASAWLRINQPGDGFTVSSAGEGYVMLNVGGRSLRLDLARAVTQKAADPAAAPATPAAAASQGPISPVVLNPTPADEARRLEDFAAELRRRRELRQQQSAGQSAAQPAKRPPGSL